MAKLTVGEVYNDSSAPPRTPGTDYVSIATNTAKESRRLLFIIAERKQIVATLSMRIRTGGQWVATHTESHPKYERAVELLDELRWEFKQARGDLRVAHFDYMRIALDCHLAYELLNDSEQQAVGPIDDIERPNETMYYAAQSNWGVEITDLD